MFSSTLLWLQLLPSLPSPPPPNRRNNRKVETPQKVNFGWALLCSAPVLRSVLSIPIESYNYKLYACVPINPSINRSIDQRDKVSPSYTLKWNQRVDGYKSRYLFICNV